MNAGLLLTGGTSSRMGLAKAELRRDGERLVDRVARVLAGVCDPVIEVGPGLSACPAVRETPVGAGPLAACVAGFEELAARGHAGPVVVLAVDLPFVTDAVLRILVDHPVPGSVVPRVEGRAQPLCARYGIDAIARAPELLLAGVRSMHGLLDAVGVVYLDDGEWASVGGVAVFADVDTPADAARAGLEGPR